MWGRPSYYCSKACARAAASFRQRQKAEGLITPAPVVEPQRRIITTCEVRVVIIGGVEFAVVWHGAVEGHWSPVKGGLCVHDDE